MAKPLLVIKHDSGVDAWGIRWTADGQGAFLSFADSSGDGRDSYLVDLVARTSRRFGGNGNSAAFYFQDNRASLPNGLSPEASGVVEAEIEGEVGSPSQVRFGPVSGAQDSEVWHHPGQTTFFTGTLTLKEKGRDVLIRQQLTRVAPSGVVQERVSVSPSLDYLVYIDGGLGGANRIYFFRLHPR